MRRRKELRKASAATLWNTPPEKRAYAFRGLLGAEEKLLSLARGSRPGVLAHLEDRATIRGGLTALRDAGVEGYEDVPVEQLRSRIHNNKSADAALCRAAKAPTLDAGADRIRRVVKKHRLSTQAWGARMLYVLENIRGFQLAHGIVAIGVNAIPVVGQFVSVGVGAHVAISAARAKRLLAEAHGYMVRPVRAKEPKPKAAVAPIPVDEAPEQPVEAIDAVPTWGWAAASAAVVVGALALRKSNERKGEK